MNRKTYKFRNQGRQQSITIPNPILSLYIDLPQSSRISNETHQALSDILDFIVLMKQTNMTLDCCSWVMSVWFSRLV